MIQNFILRDLGQVDFKDSWTQMKDFTETRTENTIDEYWVLQHNPVFTLGLSGKEEHLLFKEHNIPIIHTDRGGQVTYHGPGQIIIYTLIDLKKSGLSIRDLVERLERGVINYLAGLGIKANGDRCAPGVYVEGKKIASLGLKVRKGCTYHGLSFNAAMDITPFNYINVCGYSGLKVVQLNELYQFDNLQTIANNLANIVASEVYK